MLKVMLAEDLASEREILSEYIQRYAKENEIRVRMDAFSDGTYLLEEFSAEGADLIFLDIDMKYMDGIHTARKIREKDERVQIVFITKMVQHALEGYEVSAADYIVKPVSYELFAGKMDRVLRRAALEASERSDRLLLKTLQGQHVLSARDILYAETSGRHVIVHVCSGSPKPDPETVLETSVPLSQLEKQLNMQNFFRCHSAYLVNLRYVTGYSQSDVFLGRNLAEDGHDLIRIPLSKHRRRLFTEALLHYHVNR